MQKVSIVIPVLNEEFRIKKCLRSILNQDYPKNLIEILIFDNGCTDNTLKIASRYNCKIIPFISNRPENSHTFALKLSKADIFVIFAADNVMTSKHWLKKMLIPFEKEKISCSFTHIKVDNADFLINQYYSFLNVEPFTWFVYGNTSNPKNFSKIYKMIKKNNFELYSFSLKNHPLIALAQGLCINRKSLEFINKKKKTGDDILPFIDLINNDETFAYVDVGIFHYHVNNFIDFMKKYKKRIQNNLNQNQTGITRRLKFIKVERKIKTFLFIPYGLSIILPLFHTLIFFVRVKKIYVFYHIPTCFYLSSSIIFNYIKKTFRSN